MKLELKHIVGYLPYGLKVINNKTGQINEVDGFDVKLFYLKNEIADYHNEIKPILHPMSDLSSYHISVLRSIRFPRAEQWTKQHYSFIKEVKSFPELQLYKIVQKLYEWNFDVHMLIEKDVAVDIKKTKLCQ